MQHFRWNETILKRLNWKHTAPTTNWRQAAFRALSILRYCVDSYDLSDNPMGKHQSERWCKKMPLRTNARQVRRERLEEDALAALVECFHIAPQLQFSWVLCLFKFSLSLSLSPTLSFFLLQLITAPSIRWVSRCITSPYSSCQTRELRQTLASRMWGKKAKSRTEIQRESFIRFSPLMGFQYQRTHTHTQIYPDSGKPDSLTRSTRQVNQPDV